MKNFLEPEIELIEIEVEDIMTESEELPEFEDGAGWA